jgi:hypothetical protein
MAQLALGVVGAVITTYMGMGPAVGFAIGSAIGAVAFAPEVDVPKVADLKAPQVQYGARIPRLYGSNRTSGTLAWYSTKRIIPGNDGGSKGDPSAPTPDTAEIDVLYILAIDSDLVALTRVWRNGELVWTKHWNSPIEAVEASDTCDAWTAIRFLDGNADQLPDPTIEASEGSGNVPAYRNRSSVLIEGLKLGQSGQMPLMEFEVVGSVEYDPGEGSIDGMAPFGVFTYNGFGTQRLGPIAYHPTRDLKIVTISQYGRLDYYTAHKYVVTHNLPYVLSPYYLTKVLLGTTDKSCIAVTAEDDRDKVTVFWADRTSTVFNFDHFEGYACSHYA